MIHTEPKMSGEVKAGQVITSPKFVYGHRYEHIHGPVVVVGGEVMANAVDNSRTTSLYVVIEAGLFLNPGEFSFFPQGWSVKARRLNDDGIDTGDGEVIQFFQYFFDDGPNYGLIEAVTVVGEMKMG